jgi:hypothetical protein
MNIAAAAVPALSTISNVVFSGFRGLFQFAGCITMPPFPEKYLTQSLPPLTEMQKTAHFPNPARPLQGIALLQSQPLSGDARPAWQRSR